MRNKFIELLKLESENRDDLFLLTGDLGYAVLDSFAEKFPNKYKNCGISEQNMIGVASGLAMSGKKTFTYSIVNFSSLRCFEQIRNDICYHNIDVTVISIGVGLAYSTLGYTHFGIEDFSCVRSLPNMTIYNPADIHELEYCFYDILSSNTPKYLRIPKGGEPIVHSEKVNSDIIEIIPKSDINILSTSSILYNVKNALKELGSEGSSSIGLFSFPIINFYRIYDKVRDIIKDSKYLITIEEHTKSGGFGSMIAEIISDMPNKPIHIIKCVDYSNLKIVGDQEFLRKQNKLDKDSLKKSFITLLKN